MLHALLGHFKLCLLRVRSGPLSSKQVQGCKAMMAIARLHHYEKDTKYNGCLE